MLFAGPTSLLFTVAVLLNVFTRVPSSNVFTVTSKLNVVCPSAVTSTCIPALKSSSEYCVCELFTLMLFGTNVVPTGASSMIVAFPARCPAFCTVM